MLHDRPTRTCKVHFIFVSDSSWCVGTGYRFLNLPFIALLVPVLPLPRVYCLGLCLTHIASTAAGEVLQRHLAYLKVAGWAGGISSTATSESCKHAPCRQSPEPATRWSANSRETPARYNARDAPMNNSSILKIHGAVRLLLHIQRDKKLCTINSRTFLTHSGQWSRLHKPRGHVPPLLQMTRHGGTVGRKTANKKLTKLYTDNHESAYQND